eukprot:TRINITY_DN4528_c0_g2_i1.p1 TRINITY_DN4528_c0_g2~~TRINITY_DN4528_c0_g2_i1.p1  ORF type:complete len:423 (+),score=75.69 TRINITY_DN4528_c0_g2_i1:23-1291(+)
MDKTLPQRIRIEMAKNRSQKEKLSALICDLYQIESQMDADDSLLIDRFSRRYLNLIKDPRCPIAFLGANNSGKSLLINVLASHNICPVNCDRPSQRILHLTYCHSRKQSCIKLVSHRQDSVQPDVYHEKIESQDQYEWKDDGILQIYEQISDLLCLPENIEKGSAEYDEWISKIVSVECPLEILETGIDIYDAPGICSQDPESAKEMLMAFLNRVNPMTIFVYENPTISDQELDSFELIESFGGLLDSLGTKRPRVFFTSTRFGAARTLEDIRRSKKTPEELIQARYELLRTSKISSVIPFEKELSQSRIFGVFDSVDCNTIQTKNQASQSFIRVIRDRYLGSLARFIAYTEQQDMFDMMYIVLERLKEFFQLVDESQEDGTNPSPRSPSWCSSGRAKSTRISKNVLSRSSKINCFHCSSQN